MSTLRLVSTLGIAGLLAGGCTFDRLHSWTRADPAELSGYLENGELMDAQPDTFPFHYFYLSESLDSYDNVYIAPVNTEYLRKCENWAAFDTALAGKLGSDIDFLSDFMRRAYIQEFKETESEHRLKVVDDTKQPKTLIVETALVALVPSRAELNIIGLVYKPVGLATRILAPGSITVECRVRDAATGRIVAMYANTETDPRALLNVAGITWTYTARINMKMMARNTALVLGAKDYHTIRRDFPLHFINRIIDGNLDDDDEEEEKKEEKK